MAATDDALETYTHLPLHIDPQTKQISVLSSNKELQNAIANINSLHNSFKSLDTPNNIPPPPLPVNPKRSGQIQKLRESAVASARKGQHQDAIRLLGVGIDMAAGRPGWEPMGLAREELAHMYLSRAGAHADVQNWPEALKDAECSLECKRGPGQGPNGEKVPGNAKAYIVGGRCLMEMGRWQEAVEWLEKAIDIEGKEGDDGRELMRRLTEAKKRTESKD
jgi:translocation protein SEC72